MGDTEVAAEADEKPNRPAAEGKPPFSPLHEVLFVALLCCTQLITQSAFGSVLVPLHVIGPSFGDLSAGELSWFPAAYSLTVGTFVLIAGQLGDIHGHRKLFVGGWLWFALWSLLAGLTVYTASTVFFDVCRAMQGVGPAVLLPNSLAILGRAYAPGRRKDMVFALFASTAPTGFLCGAIFGSLLAEHVWWPWGFWITSIVCALISVLAVIVIPSESVARTEDTPTFDSIGAILGVCGLVLVNFAWNQAPLVGWSTPYIGVALATGLLSLAGFAWHESRIRHPLLPPEILKNGAAVCTMACVALGWSSFGIWIYYTFQLMETLRGVTALEAAAQFIPETISGTVAAVATGYILSRVRLTYLMAVSLLAFTAGCVLSATVPVRQTYWANIFVTMVVMPWGMDMSFPASCLILSNGVTRDRQGVAASLVNTIVNYSISVGLGIAGTVESRVNRHGDRVLTGYRAALYTSVGLSGLGLGLATFFAVRADVKR
ncbi:YOR378W-like protein [Thermoascus aurantiacus ATCC 26904]